MVDRASFVEAFGGYSLVRLTLLEGINLGIFFDTIIHHSDSICLNENLACVADLVENRKDIDSHIRGLGQLQYRGRNGFIAVYSLT